MLQSHLPVFIYISPIAFMRSSIIMAVNKIEEKPVVRNGQIVIAPMLIVNFTVDHRFVDGGSALKGT